MNAIAIGPFVFSNDRFVAILTVLTFFIVAEIVARRRPDYRAVIHNWTAGALVIWIITARLGFVIANWEGFAPAPLTVLAIWQGGFNATAGAVGLGATVLAAFFTRPKIIGPLAISILGGALAFGVATYFLPDQAKGRIPVAIFTDMSGVPVNLAARDGQPLVLNLWATWCPPCRREMPMMVDLAQSQAGVDIIFANQGEPERNIERYLDLTGLTAAGMVRDPTRALMQEFGLLGLPSTLFFTADGTLQSVHTGEISRAALLAAINDLKRDSGAE
ncbi:TlpA disulfide reductase family protein [Oceaniglobus ichthyenteri]|uniref:TlpA disulfide reductase family protein n=1 Tax=Oceaniglobus ichthyenteri TaxID=2136177 RepID=UPI000D398CD7|nr:TlpA disulfide reductase family protein [Oceaniglobus ichthyenteri]